MKKINEGYCAELFETEDGKLLKLYKDGWNNAQIRQEHESTKAVNTLGIPSPKAYGFVVGCPPPYTISQVWSGLCLPPK